MPGQRGTDVEMFAQEEGVMPSQHAAAVHMLNPLVIPLHSTCDEGEGLKKSNADDR